ncbi:glycosyltransferase family 4 protein [Rhizobium lusitanum]|uniref:Glycosyltransferase involved in cell wall biosynthesis n=1 Tax=Rhizobium lusitanum TaxID=293958 RepID=A0A7X0IR07_9HYPH|nr:glycosyltransferase family 4 protein [Rhizobium lusitanum]MBB6485561.1 glycosyltransferase involved in cell wall biosynthesis [Rhizobium lusitanum]
MKILIWSQYFWPETFRINDIAACLTTLGHEVTVLTGKPNYPEGDYYPGYGLMGVRREKWRDAEVVRIPLVRRGRSQLGLALNYLSFVVSGYLFAPRALRGQTFDLVFIYAPSPIFQALPALFLSRVRKIPSVLWIQDIWPEVLMGRGALRNRFIVGAVERVVRFIYDRSSVLLVQSEAFRRSVSRLTRHPERIQYMPNPAEGFAAGAHPTPRAVELAARMRRAFAVTFTGNLGKAQALDTVLTAAAILSNEPLIELYLVGSGSLSAWVEAEIEKRGLKNVILSDRLPATDMPEIMAASGALLVSLAADAVGEATIPSKLQSYLAAGKPIIACMDGEGARIVLEAEAGLACKAEDPADLADAIVKLYSLDEEGRRRLGENGKRYFLANFDLSFLSQRLISMFEALLTTEKER